MPPNGSSEVILASSSADFSMRSRPSREKSLEYVLAARLPKKTRTPTAREPDSFRVSTWPSRTVVENSSPSRTTASADEVLGNFPEISFEFWSSSFEFSWGHKKSSPRSTQRSQRNAEVLRFAQDDIASIAALLADSACQKPAARS